MTRNQPSGIVSDRDMVTWIWREFGDNFQGLSLNFNYNFRSTC